MTQAPTSTAKRSDTTPASTERVVVVEHLTKTFKDFWMRERVKAVDDVTFDVRRGEIFGLLGPNGSGKSTTIKILLGLLHKSTGRCSVLGKLPTDVAAKKRIGYLPEESYLYQFLNARETLDYYAKLFELDSATRERRIDELLEMVGLTAVQFRPVREYSKGMQRRIGIAQALINDPELLILDEPTTGLDPIGTRQIKDLILDLGRRGKTVILSSHLLGDVEDCVDRMVILYGGKIQAAGTCDELLEAHDRTTIETDALDEETISAIDALIRQRSGGQKAVGRVSKPRQKLEDLFVGIVEKARADKLETAGAQHGGRTAAFLRGDDEASGEALISKLLKAEEPVARVSDAPSAPVKPSGPDVGVIGGLLGGEPGEESGRPVSSTTGSKMPVPPGAKTTGGTLPVPSKDQEKKKAGHDVDQGVIGSLLDGGKDGKSKP
jgi:ABC-2 type transport system ATP-binding protein